MFDLSVCAAFAIQFHWEFHVSLANLLFHIPMTIYSLDFISLDVYDSTLVATP